MVISVIMEEQKNVQGRTVAKYRAIGIAIGLVLGAVLGKVLDNIAAGIAVGLGLGIAVGSVIDRRKGIYGFMEDSDSCQRGGT